MGEGECEPVETSKRGRHRKKQLYNSILHQMEFYFSDSNLCKDRFLSQLLKQDPYIGLNIFLNFNKIRKLNCTPEDIRKAIGKSELIELSEDREKIRRKVPIRVKDNEDDCTIYVENIKADDNHETLSHIFTDFGNVVYVSVPKYKHTKSNKGFAFVEFEKEHEAQNALDYFENIGCKMPLETNPEDLISIKTFEDDKNIINKIIEKGVKIDDRKKTNEESEAENDNIKSKAGNSNIESEVGNDNIESKTGKSNMESEAGYANIDSKIENNTIEANSKKRKLSEEENNQEKKLKMSESELIKDDKNNSVDKLTVDEEDDKQDKIMDVDDAENKKKKKHKKDKRKAHIKELGIQILSKKEWKKLRNRYLDLQKKKMKEFKQYLYKERFNSNNYQKAKQSSSNQGNNAQQVMGSTSSIQKLQFTPGVIVKLILTESCEDCKKLKNDLKSTNPAINYVDATIGSSEVFLRFSSSEAAKDFCCKEHPGEKTVIEGNEEKAYWERIQNERTVKFNKNAVKSKQRGRVKLLKKAEKERAKHIKFDEND